jgi:hypothetical protein
MCLTLRFQMHGQVMIHTYLLIMMFKAIPCEINLGHTLQVTDDVLLVLVHDSQYSLYCCIGALQRRKSQVFQPFLTLEGRVMHPMSFPIKNERVYLNRQTSSIRYSEEFNCSYFQDSFTPLNLQKLLMIQQQHVDEMKQNSMAVDEYQERTNKFQSQELCDGKDTTVVADNELNVQGKSISDIYCKNPVKTTLSLRDRARRSLANTLVKSQVTCAFPRTLLTLPGQIAYNLPLQRSASAPSIPLVGDNNAVVNPVEIQTASTQNAESIVSINQPKYISKPSSTTLKLNDSLPSLADQSRPISVRTPAQIPPILSPTQSPSRKQKIDEGEFVNLRRYEYSLDKDIRKMLDDIKKENMRAKKIQQKMKHNQLQGANIHSPDVISMPASEMLPDTRPLTGHDWDDPTLPEKEWQRKILQWLSQTTGDRARYEQSQYDRDRETQGLPPVPLAAPNSVQLGNDQHYLGSIFSALKLDRDRERQIPIQEWRDVAVFADSSSISLFAGTDKQFREDDENHVALSTLVERDLQESKFSKTEQLVKNSQAYSKLYDSSSFNVEDMRTASLLEHKGFDVSSTPVKRLESKQSGSPSVSFDSSMSSMLLAHNQERFGSPLAQRPPSQPKSSFLSPRKPSFR